MLAGSAGPAWAGPGGPDAGPARALVLGADPAPSEGEPAETPAWADPAPSDPAPAASDPGPAPSDPAPAPPAAGADPTPGDAAELVTEGPPVPAPLPAPGDDAGGEPDPDLQGEGGPDSPSVGEVGVWWPLGLLVWTAAATVLVVRRGGHRCVSRRGPAGGSGAEGGEGGVDPRDRAEMERAEAGAAFWMLLAAVAVWLALTLGAVSAAAILGLDLARPDEDARLLPGALAMLGGYTGQAITLGVVLGLAPTVRRPAGLRWKRPIDAGGRAVPGGAWAGVRAGLLGSAMIVPAAWLLGIVSVWAASALGVGPERALAHDTLEALVGAARAAGVSIAMDPGWVLTIGLVVVAAPIFEEVVYRGLLQGALRGATGSPWVGVGASAALFAVMHAGIADLHTLGVLVFLGAAFGVLRERTGSLVAPIVAHAVFNAAIVGLALFGV